MRRLALLIAAGSLWLFLAAVPALADGGPHVASANSGVSTLTADSCAGCHRAHTAKGEALINANTAEDLCLNCHGSAGTGASVNVEDGVQYTLASRVGTGGTVLGALRNGGFVHARIDSANPVRVTYPRTAVDASFRAKVPVGSAANTTSAHLTLAGAAGNGLVNKDIAWGNGAAGSGAGATSTALECTSCHNPHGNGQYRILNTMASLDGNGFVNPVSYTVSNAYAYTDRFFTSSAHGLIVGDLVTITGLSSVSYKAGGAGSAIPLADGVYVVTGVPTGTSFTLSTAPTKTSADLVNGLSVDVQADAASLTGTLKRFSAVVDDAPLPTLAGDERNYTIQQVRGYQGTPASYILYVSDLQNAMSGNSFVITADVVGVATSFAFSAPINTVNNVIFTGLAHGFANGDAVWTSGLGSYGVSDGAHTIASIPSSTSFTLSGVTVSTTAPTSVQATVGFKLGTVAKTVAGTFNATAGDYFHRTVPWNPAVVNASCPNNVVVDSTVNPELASACTTAQDAPNGRPATVTSKLKINGTTDAVTPSAFGQVAFNDQISAWCSTCHTRYYSSTNPNPGGEASATTDYGRNISAVTAGTDTLTVSSPDLNSTVITSTGFSVGDVVKFTGTSITATGFTSAQFIAANWYVVKASQMTFQVAASIDAAPVDITGGSAGGTVVRLYPGSASSWYFSRPGDTLYKYQHQTTTNRSCVTCHVSHGTDATMATGAGTFSGAVAYPNGDPGSGINNSRLLKINNRGTCQMCHDPTGTMIANPGQVLPTGAPALTVP